MCVLVAISIGCAIMTRVRASWGEVVCNEKIRALYAARSVLTSVCRTREMPARFVLRRASVLFSECPKVGEATEQPNIG